MAVYRFLSFAAPDPTFELELRIDSPTTHKDYGLNCSKLLQMFRTSYFGFELDKATITKTALVLIEFEIRDWRLEMDQDQELDNLCKLQIVQCLLTCSNNVQCTDTMKK